MAIGQVSRPCTIVLHDDSSSTEDALCGLHVLAVGEVGFLIAANARTLCIVPKFATRNGDEVSVHTSVARRFGLENRAKAKVEVVGNEDDAVATHVELTFRDQYVSRADMWRMKAQAEDKVVYKGQKLRYLGSTVAEVANVYIAGHEVDSAIVSHPRTKLIFRSYSARYTVLIQVSKEMLQHWDGGNLMFERLASEFLPDLFDRWDSSKAHHQITVVLFGRRLCADARAREHVSSGQNADWEKAPLDFFRVVVSEMPSTDGRMSLRKLRKLFQGGKLPQDVCLAAEGNMLEAIHLAALDFADDNLAPPASSTGTSIIAITAGAGLFQADHAMLKLTTELLLGNSIGVDIVSLSPKPFHPVPLFQYQLNSDTEYALPHWLDISHWTGHSQTEPDWKLINCAGEFQRISLPPLQDESLQYTVDAMSAYDEDIFAQTEDTLEKTLSHETTIDLSSQTSDHKKTLSNNSGNPLKGIAAADMQPRSAKKEKTHVTAEAQHPNGASTASVPLTNRAKREALPPHPLMQNFRKISVGPKGLAPSQSVASTTVSAHHVQQDRDTPTTISPPRENPSLLARQIRDSLKRKPSQRTLTAHEIHEPSGASRPITIRTSEELASGSASAQDKSDPASLIEKGVLERESGPNSNSDLATPRMKQDSLPLPGLSSIDTQDGSNTPWLALLNPCDPKRDNMRIASEYRKWQTVFPRAVSSGSFKWDSMCSPATLPLMTEVRVSMTDLERHFTKKVRRLLVMPSLSPTSDSAQDVLHQLIALRLSAGFQIVPTRKLKREQTAGDYIEKIILSLGSLYHELRHLSKAEIQITEYERPDEPVTENGVAQTEPAIIYTARIRSALSHSSSNIQVPLESKPFIQDWSTLDDQCANPAVSADEQGICRMRFVLIPVHSSDAERTILSDEERRIDGIQKLTLMWQRHRHIPAEDQQNHASMMKPKGAKVERDPNPLAIEYHTRDPSAVVGALAAEKLDTVLKEGSEDPEADVYHSSNFDITKLVKHMQEPPPNGVELRDRRWFTRLHFKCFRGDEMCNWIVRVFKDLKTREDAVMLGNQLMDREIFTHVRGKHEFRDGHYLYQIRGAYRTTDYPDNAGLFSKAIGRSIPSTPLVEMKQSPSIRAIQGDSDSWSSGRLTPTPTSAPVTHKEKKTVLLTEKLRYNVDPNGKSEQLEVVSLHYDRIHNPENCYHIQLDWTSTTPKLIRESVSRWSSVVEGHGLRLAQLPMKEVCKLREQHPFDLPISIKLALRPPKRVPATPVLDAQGQSLSAAPADAMATHKALLRKLDFVLDFEAASSFPKTADVSYSWGKPDFDLTQFVHKSGLLLVQIANDGEADFILLSNRLAAQPTAIAKKADIADINEIVDKLRSFCRSEEALKAFYSDLNRPKADLTSPFAQANRVADFDVPPMELPPHLMQRVRS